MSDEEKYISLYRRHFTKTCEERANELGCTFGENAELLEKIRFWLTVAHIYRLITDRELDKIFYRFEKLLNKWAKELEE